MPGRWVLLTCCLILSSVFAASLTLTSSQNPSVFGSPVTLTATLSAPGTGKVTFYDGATMLGVGAVSGSSAGFTTIGLPSGVRNLRAYYAGATATLTQTVNAVPSLGLKGSTVNTTLSGTGMALPFIVAADVNGDSKVDLLTAQGTNYVNVYLGNGDGSFRAPVAYPISGGVGLVATGDFNSDGKLDLVVSSSGNTPISILLGNGEGTFQAAAAFSIGSTPYSISVGDLDGDGTADLLITGSTPATALRYLPGNGDGTFKTPVSITSPTGLSFQSTTIGDLNGDGKADFVANGLYYTNSVIYLGNGDGTFTGQPYNTALITPAIFGDVNGDGKMDMAFGVSQSYGGIQVLLGKGDGTFQPAVASGYYAYASVQALADVNGDGKLDAIFATNYPATLNVALGNGDGTFQTGKSYTPNVDGITTLATEVNGDGQTDLLALPAYSTTLTAFLGGAVPDLTVALSHEAGFTQGQTGALYRVIVKNIGEIASVGAVGVVDVLPTGLTATAIAGSGWTCVLSTLTCTRSDSLAASASYPPILISVNVGNTPGPITGSVTVSGGSDGNNSNNIATDVTNIRYATTIGITSTPNPSTLGASVTISATVGSGTGIVSFYDGDTMLGTAAISNGQALFTTKLLPSGGRSLTARYVGDANFGPVFSSTRIQTVNPVSANGATVRSIVLPNTGYGVVGDFNRDGKADLAVAGTSAINILLGNGDGTFQSPVAYPVASVYSLLTVVAGDLNGDGKTDLVGSTYNGGDLIIMLGKGDGTFQAPTTLSDTNPGIVSIVDINNDGNADLVQFWQGVTVRLGKGDGTFQDPLRYALGNFGSGTTQIADMNKDGKLDIVSYDESNSGVRIFLGNGDGTFQPVQTYPYSAIAFPSLVVGEFMGYPRLDVAIVSWSGISLLRGDGSGGLLPAATSASNIPTPFGTSQAGDFNGDGMPDIAYRGYYNNTVSIAFGNGFGSFPSVSTATTDGATGNIVLGEFNGDGKPDFVVFNQSSINLFLGAQSSGLSIATTHASRITAGRTGTYQIVVTNPSYNSISGVVTVTPSLPSGLTLSTMNGNGWNCNSQFCQRSDSVNMGSSFDPIILVVNASSGLSASTVTPQVAVAYNGITNRVNDPTAIVLATSTSLTSSQSALTLGAATALKATITGSGAATGSVAFYDGVQLLGSSALSGGVASYTAQMTQAGRRTVTAVYAGDATHGPSQSAALVVTVTAAQASGFAAPATYSTGSTPSGIVSADLNGDGILDLVTPNIGSNSVSVLLGNGDGTFQAKVDYVVGLQPNSVAVADMNGDGKKDLVVANSGEKTIHILLGSGSGTFQSPNVLNLDLSPNTVAVADFDLDAKPDLLITFQNEFRVMLNNGDGTFRKTASFSNSLTSIAAVDFNADGIPDILTNYYGSLFVYPGKGDGTFEPSKYYSTASSQFIVAGDLNGDGWMDVVGVDSGGSVYVLLGQANGTLLPYVAYSSGAQGASLALGDVNGDGKLDVILTGAGGNAVYLLYGKGDGTLQAAISYPAGVSPNGIVVGDFNGDGKTDLALSNNNGNNIAVLIGMLNGVLVASSTHSGNFLFNQTNATYTISVTNSGPGPTTGALTVVDTLPAGLTATAISGAGWNCTLATLTCTRPATLPAGASAQPITITVTVASNASAQVTNAVTASASGAVTATASDVTAITALPPATPLLPANGTAIIGVNPSLSWTASAGATSYDVYFGPQNPPALLANTTSTSYSPTGVVLNSVYYWRIVAKNTSGSASSATWSFRTTAASTVVPYVFREDFETLSDYDYVPPLAAGVTMTQFNAPLWPEGTYTITKNPQSVHPLFCSFGDHTTGSTRMLVANGRGGAVESVWARTVSGLTVGVQYQLSVWVASAYHDAPAILRFTVDGSPINQTVTASSNGASCPTTSATPLWRQLVVTFTATSTQAAINLQDLNLVPSGNDFAIDDVELVPVGGGTSIFKEDFEVLSDYQYVAPLKTTPAPYLTSPLWPEGTYTISANPQSNHPLFCSFTGHGGAGKMLVANGRGGRVESIWSRTVSGLTPGSQYRLSVWAANAYHVSPPTLQFTVDNVVVGTPLTLLVSGAACPATPSSPLWQQLVVTFTAQSSQAVINLQDTNLTAGGNDMAIDDIELILN